MKRKFAYINSEKIVPIDKSSSKKSIGITEQNIREWAKEFNIPNTQMDILLSRFKPNPIPIAKYSVGQHIFIRLGAGDYYWPAAIITGTKVKYRKNVYDIHVFPDRHNRSNDRIYEEVSEKDISLTDKSYN